MSSIADFRSFIFGHFQLLEDGSLGLSSEARDILLSAFRQVAHRPDAEEHGKILLEMIGLLGQLGETNASKSLIDLAAQVLEELRFDDPSRTLREFRGDRLLALAPAAGSAAPEGSKKARSLARFRV